ncbi:MAG: substrate-binding domain-containing protein [Planctomycetes bacterium]|nr:substrate-binding domain-containing protein [Planctomycetota bacterium]
MAHAPRRAVAALGLILTACGGSPPDEPSVDRSASEPVASAPIAETAPITPEDERAPIAAAARPEFCALLAGLGQGFGDVAEREVAIAERDDEASIRGVAEGDLDFALLGRHKVASPIERDVVFHPIGWDALVVVVHPDNPVDTITSDDLARVLLGQVTNWEELGGFDEFLHLYSHEDRASGIGRMARELLFADASIAAQVGTVLGPSESPVERVESDPEGLALASRLGATRHAVKLVAIDGTSPTRVNMRVAGYPLMMPIYLVVRREAGESVAEFVEFCRGTGQRCVALAGGVGLADGQPLWAPYRHRMRAAHVRIGR